MAETPVRTELVEDFDAYQDSVGSDEHQPALARTVMLMDRIHASEVFATPKHSKEFLDSLDYDGFKKWISFVNGVEREIPQSERGQVSDSRVKAEGLMGGYVEYRPPHKDFRDQLLKTAFEKAQSLDDPEAAALTLGFSINAIHYFEDGNGRTARMAFALLSRGYTGSPEDQAFYSALLENTKGREVVNPNPAISGVDKRIRSEMLRDASAKFGFSAAFDGRPPTSITDGYQGVLADEYSPSEVAAGQDIDEAGRARLHRVLENDSVAMASLMATFGPDKVKDFVQTGGEEVTIDGNAFLPTLTSEDITRWWLSSEKVIATYVKRIINVADRTDFAEVAAYYKSQTPEVSDNTEF